MVGTVLAVDVGLKLPHCEAGVQDQFTVAFWGPLAMIAAMPAVLPIVIEVGGASGWPAAGKVTLIGWVVELELLPQAASMAASVATTSRRAARRNVIGRLRLRRACRRG